MGVGDGFYKREINQIATDPDSTYAFALDDFEKLSSVLKDKLAERACTVIAEVPVKKLV